MENRECSIAKYECNDCGEQFIIGREVLEEKNIKEVACPYCTSQDTEEVAWKEREDMDELDLGCMGIMRKEEEEKEKKMLSIMRKCEVLRLPWSDIAGSCREELRVGDELSLELKDGQVLRMQVVDIDESEEPRRITFISKECLKERMPMNQEWTNKGGWEASDLRKRLNTEIIKLLPDELAAVIKEREIRQQLNDGVHTTLDKLWLPTERDMVGDEAYDSGCMEEKQFELYKDPLERVKKIPGETAACNYWESSPRVGYSTTFCNMTPSGTVNYGNASNSLGVVLCFCI